jgi:hypothetical protein
MKARRALLVSALLIVTIAAGCKRGTRPATVGNGGTPQSTTITCPQNLDTCPVTDGQTTYLQCPNAISIDGNGNANPDACCLSIAQGNQTGWNSRDTVHDRDIFFANGSPFGSNHIALPHGGHADSGLTRGPKGCYGYAANIKGSGRPAGDPTIIITK